MNISAAEVQAMSEYEDSLTIPPQPVRKQFILCPVGIVGAGKTTVLKPMSEKLSLVRISGDEIRKSLKEHGLGYDALVPIGSELSKKYLAQGYSLALDSDAASPRSKAIIQKAEQEFGVIPIWIHINPPEEFILNKLRTHEQPTWLFESADQAVQNYMDRKYLHEDLAGYNFVYEFDTSKNDLDKQIGEAVSIIEKIVNAP